MAGGNANALVEKQLVAATQIIEQQLDAEIERLDNLDSDDLDAIRRERLEAMKKRQNKKQEWIDNVVHAKNCNYNVLNGGLKSLFKNNDVDKAYKAHETSYDFMLLKPLPLCCEALQSVKTLSANMAWAKKCPNLGPDEMKKRQWKKKIVGDIDLKWKNTALRKNKGHGDYSELYEEKEFFEATKKSDNVVCHFYRDQFLRCKIVDKHLNILAKKHIETKFCKINAEKAPFLTERLHIRVLPTLCLVKDGKTKDYIIGFTDLGNTDDFTTEMMEWRIGRADVIEYSGDLLCPPSNGRSGQRMDVHRKKTIRGGKKGDSDDSDSDY